MINYNFINKKYFPVLFIAFLAVLFMTPMFVVGQAGGDRVFHESWYNIYAELFWQGELLPRWSHEQHAACGAADFYFYSTFFYAISAFFEWTDLGGQGHMPRTIGALLFTLLAGIGIYKLCRLFTERIAALCAVCVFMFSGVNTTIFYPYYLLTFYASFGYAALLIYFSCKLAKERKGAIVGVALCFGLLTVSSVTSGVIFGAMSVCVALGYAIILKTLSFKVCFQLFVAIALGAGVAAYYTLPIAYLLETTLYQDTLYGTLLAYDQNFLGVFVAPEDATSNARVQVTMTYQLVLCVVLLSILFCYLLKEKRAEKYLWFSAAGVTCFMMLPVSQPMWEYIPLLHKIQFPWRLLACTMVALAVLVAMGVQKMLETKPENDVIPIFGILFFVFVLSPSIIIVSGYMEEREMIALDDSGIREEAMAYNHLAPSMYLDKRSEELHHRIQSVEGGKQLKAFCEKKVTHLDGTQNNIDVKRWENKNILFEVNNQQATDVLVMQTIFTGWKADILKENDIIPLELKADKETGVMRVSLPEGKHTVHVYRERMWAENVGLAITIVALLTIFILYRHEKRPKTA